MASVSVEQAARTALATWLAAKLPDVKVTERWPSPERPLQAKAITVLLAGARRDSLIDPSIVGSETIHVAVTTQVATTLAVDLATAISKLNDCKARWNAHLASTAAHLVADVANVETLSDAVDLATAVPLANDLRAKLAPHISSSTYHSAIDTKSVIMAPVAFDLASLVQLVNDEAHQINKHLAARIDLWQVRLCEQPMQLDVWATFDAVRDDIMARLEPALNADIGESMGAPAPTDPVRNGVLLNLGNGWTGTVDFTFDEPMRIDSSDGAQQSEWRATYRGVADFVLVVKAQSARMLRQVLKATNYQKTTVGVSPDVTIVT